MDAVQRVHELAGNVRCNMAKLLCLDVYGNALRIVECEGLQDYYDALGCDLIDITRVKIRGKVFDVICDDEGLFKEDKRISAIESETGLPLLVGNLLFANHNGPETTSLTDEDIEKIATNVVYLSDLQQFAVFCDRWPDPKCTM